MLSKYILAITSLTAVSYALPGAKENAKVYIPDSQFAIDQGGNIVYVGGGAGDSASLSSGVVQPLGAQHQAAMPNVQADPATGAAPPAPAAQVLEPVHRFYDSFGHFYTKNRNEIFDSRYRGMQYENVAFCVWNQPPDATNYSAVLRYERDHGADKKFDRLLTIDPAEIGTTVVGEVGRGNFKFIENLGYVAKSPQLGLSAIYRYYNDAGSHFYTRNPNEIGVSTAGQRNGPWTCEGIIGYAKPQC